MFLSAGNSERERVIHPRQDTPYRLADVSVRRESLQPWDRIVCARYRVPETQPTLNGHHDALQQKKDFEHRREATPHNRVKGTSPDIRAGRTLTSLQYQRDNAHRKDTTTTPDANLFDEHTKTHSADCVSSRHPLRNVFRTVFFSCRERTLPSTHMHLTVTRATRVALKIKRSQHSTKLDYVSNKTET